MKKSLIILLVLAVLVTFGLASCKNEVQAPADELVSVSFEQAVSRALTATVQEFDKNDYYWYYAAAKTDSTGLISGQTASYDYAGAEAVRKDGEKGLGTIPGFSQGSWKFMLFAYAEKPTTADAKAAFIYSGEALAVTLRKNGTNMVSVTVSPATTGNGILFVDMANIELDEEAAASHNTVPGSVTVTKVGETTPRTPESGTNVEYELAAGQYKVTVEFTDGDIVFATGMVLATVYPGLKTTVTGDVAELITYAEFDAKRNPDIIMTTAGSDDIPAGSTSTDPIALVDEATEKRVSASVPADAAQALIPAGASSMTLALNVDTTDSTSTSVTYDISMYKTIVTAAEAETSKVNSVSKIVTVTIKLSKGLTGVEVTHSGNAMNKLTSKDQDAEGYFYDDSTAEYATLYIKTKSFSPFEVKYDAVDGVAQLGNVKYATLVDAFNAAVDSGKKSTIYLLKDASGKGIFLAQNLGADITVDLGGHTYTCSGPAVGSATTETQAWHLEKNNKVTIKNGKLDCTSDAGVYMLIQNYCDLTLQDVVVDGTKLPASGDYVLSGNNGDILITGKTNIIAKAGDYAFDVCYTNYYPNGVRYVFDENYTGTVTGTIQLDVWGTLPDETNCSLTIKAGTFKGSFDIQSVLSQHAIDDSHISGGRFMVNVAQDYIEDGYMVKDGGDGYYYVVPVVAKIGDTYYASLADAIAAVPTTGELRTIYLLADVKDAKGMSVPEGKNFIVDFGGHTYTVNKPGAGSTGTETAAFQLKKSSTIVFKNGTINISEDNLTPAEVGKKNIHRIIQNYADLTLDNMAIYAENQYDGEAYCLSFNNGNSVLKNGTKVITTSDETVAFDSCNWVDGGYNDVRVTIENGVVVNGKIEVGGGVENLLKVANGATVGTVFAEDGYELISTGVEGYMNYTITIPK